MEELKEIILENALGTRVVLCNYGAMIKEIFTRDKHGNPSNIVLTLPKKEQYLAKRTFLGATVGRVAGRISNGRCVLPNGEKLYLSKNEKDHHLHGGYLGFDNQVWSTKVGRKGQDKSVSFYLKAEDGEQGYPGEIKVKVSYILKDSNQLIIQYEAVTNKDTLFNPTNHTYFNLGGKIDKTINHHILKVNSEYYLPINKDSIPIGTIMPTNGTIFNLKDGIILEEILRNKDCSIKEQNGLNHPFLLNKDSTEQLELTEPISGRVLNIITDCPAVVIYTGNHFSEEDSLLDKSGIRKHGGIALECQQLPDAINNQPHFGNSVLKQGDRFFSQTIYTFGCV
ncbi:galactose mutarotase [Niallia alba]|uniref:aldose epimerase family protein n=1 Tax=Niallia alba TaxID=2729105 RepID=UPI002E1E236A|nr:galactose mutarotase [Niallia alba]